MRILLLHLISFKFAHRFLEINLPPFFLCSVELFINEAPVPIKGNIAYPLLAKKVSQSQPLSDKTPVL